MLDGVPGFVSGNAERGEAVAVIVFLTQHQTFARRIVMVSEVPLSGADFDSGYASRVEHILSSFTTGDATAGAKAGPFPVG